MISACPKLSEVDTSTPPPLPRHDCYWQKYEFRSSRGARILIQMFTAAAGGGDAECFHWTRSHVCKWVKLTGLSSTVEHGRRLPVRWSQISQKTWNRQWDRSVRSNSDGNTAFVSVSSSKQSFIDRRHLSSGQSGVWDALMFYLQNQLFKICWSVFQCDRLLSLAGWGVSVKCKLRPVPCDTSVVMKMKVLALPGPEGWAFSFRLVPVHSYGIEPFSSSSSCKTRLSK